MKTAPLSTLVKFFDSSLKTESYHDTSQNGLQVESSQSSITTIGCAVDSGLGVIEEAIRRRCQLLIVHHGLLWSQPIAVRNVLGKKIELLLKAGCSLYASHLPLDGDLTLGNAAELARFFSLKNIKPAFPYHGSLIGVTASCARPKTIKDFLPKGRTMLGATEPYICAHGPKKIQTIGVVTGSGSFALEECARLKLDLLISGEPKHEVFHTAQELKANAIFFGHYATETFGVRALAAAAQKKFGVKTEFIDIPSGI